MTVPLPGIRSQPPSHTSRRLTQGSDAVRIDYSFFLMEHQEKPSCILLLSDLSHLRGQRWPRLCIIF